jgi:hypothetical protein
MSQWESYEQVGTYLLDQFAAEFGLDRVEAKQEMPGQRSEQAGKSMRKAFGNVTTVLC